MGVSKYSVVCNEKEKNYFHILIEEIKLGPPSLAKVIKDGIKERITIAQKFPDSFESDIYTSKNKGDYRKNSFIPIRLAHKINNLNKELMIIRVRHSSSEPSIY